MKQRSALAAGLLLLLAAFVPGFTAISASGAPGSSRPADPPLWLPSESWPGGRQHDPRLDRSVRFWGAGIPLRDVFASVREQTGVEIGFLPPGDDNERICVNLYLNPHEPPTLRELMAQLTWVTDCRFAFSEGQDGQPRYELLTTSIGQGDVRQRVEEDILAADIRWDMEQEAVRAEMRQRFPARLAEFERALDLTREELIARHRGADDLMLLALLDPRPRAVGRFALALSEEDMARLVAGEELVRPWFDWSAEQRAWLKRSIWAEAPEWSAAAQAASPADGPGDWLDRAQPQVNMHLTGEGLYASGVVDEAAPRGSAWGRTFPFLALIMNDTEEDIGYWLHLQSQLRKALGEPFTEDQERQIEKEQRERQQRDWRRRQVQERLTGQQPRLADARGLLESLTLPVETDREYALWQIQEAVAVASGMHVLSDCFWQPDRRLSFLLDPLYPEGAPALSALDILRLSCLAYNERQHLIHMSWRDLRYAEGWEWGQAGQFLRFRSLNRDMWRGALLPPDLVEAIHSWIEPYLARDPETGRYPPVVEVPLDLRRCAEVAAQVDEANWRWGCGLIYGSLTDERHAYLRAFREEMLSFLLPAWRGVDVFRGLTDDQWQRLHDEGLTWRAELATQPFRAERSRDVWVEGSEVVRLVETASAAIEWDHDPTPPPERAPIDRESWGGWHQLRVVSGRRRAPEHVETGVTIVRGPAGRSLYDFPTTLKLRPKSTARLVAPP